VTGRLPLLARLVERNLDPLPEIGAGLREEDDDLRGLVLSEKEPLLPALARPVVEQLQRGARHAGPPRGLPLLEALADAVDQLQLD